MTAKLDTLQALLVEELKDLYSAETQLTKALPKMAKAASSEKLKQAFLDHLEETKNHLQRLKKATEILGETPQGKTCKAMEGLITEGEELIEEEGEDIVKDAGLICAAQKVEHYEMAGYGSARTFAEVLGLNDVADILQETLDEEGAADELLTEIAETINDEAEEVSNESR